MQPKGHLICSGCIVAHGGASPEPDQDEPVGGLNISIEGHTATSKRETCSFSMPLVLSSTQPDFLPNAANQQIGLCGPML